MICCNARQKNKDRNWEIQEESLKKENKDEVHIAQQKAAFYAENNTMITIIKEILPTVMSKLTPKQVYAFASGLRSGGKLKVEHDERSNKKKPERSGPFDGVVDKFIEFLGNNKNKKKKQPVTKTAPEKPVALQTMSNRSPADEASSDKAKKSNSTEPNKQSLKETKDKQPSLTTTTIGENTNKGSETLDDRTTIDQKEGDLQPIKTEKNNKDRVTTDPDMLDHLSWEADQLKEKISEKVDEFSDKATKVMKQKAKQFSNFFNTLTKTTSQEKKN